MKRAEDVFLLIVVVGVLISVFLLINLRIVQPYERAVMTSMGQIQSVAGPGINLTFWPFTERHTYNVKNQVLLFNGGKVMSAATKDLQDAKLSVAVNFHVDSASLKDIYLNFGYGYVENIVEPAVLDGVKSASSQFTAEELITKRQEFVTAAEKLISQKMGKIFMVLDKVAITNVQFSDSFNSAIEAKVRTQQQAEQAKNELKKTEYESQQKITRSKAEAETIRIQAEAIQSQGGAEYVNLKAVEKWDGKLPVTFVPGSALPFLNIK